MECSYNVYDLILRPTDAIADADIAPKADGANSFADATAEYGDAYTAYMEFTGRPETPQPNTIYAGEVNLGSLALPQPALTALFYRVYVPGEDMEFDDGGFLSNIHNAYTTNLFSRSYGNVVMIRAKAPSYRDQPGVPFDAEQLRYWSVCQNDLPTQRYVGCVADYQAHLDDQGYFTVMVSDTADRPINALAENGVDWLPWGPYVDALLIYRHMLPQPGFAETIHNVPQGTEPADIMGEYVPRSAYCQRDIVEGAGDKPADIFAACRAYSESLSRLGL